MDFFKQSFRKKLSKKKNINTPKMYFKKCYTKNFKRFRF